MPLTLDRPTIERALGLLNARLEAAGVTGELCIFGGSAMILAFDARPTTRDVDAVFRPPVLVREAAAAIAEELSLPENWLNDGVKGFVSNHPEYVTDGLPQFPHLRVLRPSASYLFAMKCIAARVDGYDTPGDKRDALFLARHLSLTSVDQALDIVTRYYPASRIAVKTQYFVAEIIEDLAKE